MSFFGRLWRSFGETESAQSGNTLLFGVNTVGLESDPRPVVPWEKRALEVGASDLRAEHGMQQLQALWRVDKQMQQMSAATLARMKSYLHFASLPRDQEFIHQDEHGNFLVILLKGVVVVERAQIWGERLHLSEAVAGEMLGEMSLLDQGQRFSACVTRSTCEVAVLTTEAMNRMVAADAWLVACLMTMMARKLSLRLRVVGARLSDRI